MTAARASQAPWRPVVGLLFLAGLATASLLPEPWKGRTALPGIVHDGAHMAAFVVAFLLANGRHIIWRKALLLAVGLLAFGMTLEILETAEFNNRLEYRDMLDDAIGIAAGMAVSGIGATNPSRKRVRTSW